MSVNRFLCFLSLSHSYLNLGMKRTPAARTGDTMQASVLYYNYILFVYTASAHIKTHSQVSTAHFSSEKQETLFFFFLL